MATVIRVKRRLDEEPLDALLISCKRQKTELEETQIGHDTAVVKFAGTVTNQKENVVKHLSKTLTKDELKANYKQHVADSILEKTRTQTKETSKQNRWKFINTSRCVDTTDDKNINDNGMTIVDIEDCSTELPHNEAAEYVYDLYYTKHDGELAFDDNVSIHEFEECLVFDNFREGEVYSDHDDSDSNSESNWKNDYPDSDPFTDEDDDSINEDDMINAFNRCDIDGEYSMSSDEDIDYLCDQGGFNHPGGRKYAEWKARYLQEIGENEDSNSDLSDYDGPVITEVDTDDEKIDAD